MHQVADVLGGDAEHVAIRPLAAVKAASNDGVDRTDAGLPIRRTASVIRYDVVTGFSRESIGV